MHTPSSSSEATSMPLDYEEFARKVPAEDLALELDSMHENEKHLTEIAKCLIDWDDVATELGLQAGIIRNIKENKDKNNPK